MTFHGAREAVFEEECSDDIYDLTERPWELSGFGFGIWDAPVLFSRKCTSETTAIHAGNG